VNWTEPAHLQAALVCAGVCAPLGWFAPRVVARLPEPVEDPQKGPDPGSEAGSQPDPAPAGQRKLFARELPPAPDKEPYADIAALPHLSLWFALSAAVIGASFGLALGWTGALLYLVPLAPIGVVLMVIDWRTTLLPTRIMHPTYLLLAVLIPLAALIDQDLSSLYRAGWGWLIIGGWFWIFWWLLNAWGFGDVRLARVLGPALGFLGWTQLLMGLALIVFVGAVGSLALAIARGSLRARVPYGPSMLVAALLTVLIGPWLARSLGY